MEKKYKCEMCGSESTDTPGICCSRERKAIDSKMEHNHQEGAICPVCNAK